MVAPVALLTLVGAIWADEPFDPPAPQWLLEAEQFNGWYRAPKPGMVEELFPKFRCIVGWPRDPWSVEELHQRGIRVIPYIDFVQLPWPEKGGQKHYTLTFEGHADWIRVDEKGEYVPTFYAPNKGWYQSCFNAKGFMEAALAKVRRAMEGGCDGLFFDDCGSCRPECSGPKFGQHEHVNPEWTNVDAMDHFLVEARKAIKAFGSDKILMMNAWRPNPRWERVCDCQMWESFIHGSNRGREYNLVNMLYIADHWADYADRGKRIAALSYVGTSTGDVKEDAYFDYVWARLLGFTWADWFTLHGKPGAELYSVRLGKYLTEFTKLDDVAYRVCERGVLVATIRHGGQSAAIPIPAGYPHKALVDLFTGEGVSVTDGHLRVTLPDKSGRVYVAEAGP